MPEENKFNSKSSIMSSPYFAVIMDSYDKFGRSLSAQAFWRQYVAPVDPKIIYMTWLRFERKINKTVSTKQEIIMNKIIEKKTNENEMEKSSLQNILNISEATLDTLVENPDLLAQIPIKERMKWLFQAMKARDSRMVALTKVNAEKRKSTMWEDMIQAAQYGEIDESEFSENDAPLPQVAAPSPTQIIKQEEKTTEKEAKVVEFDPDKL